MVWTRQGKDELYPMGRSTFENHQELSSSAPSALLPILPVMQNNKSSFTKKPKLVFLALQISILSPEGEKQGKVQVKRCALSMNYGKSILPFLGTTPNTLP